MPNQRKNIDFICHPDGTVERCIPKEPSFQEPYRYTKNINTPKIRKYNTNQNSGDLKYYLIAAPILIPFFIFGIMESVKKEIKGKTLSESIYLMNQSSIPLSYNNQIKKITEEEIMELIFHDQILSNQVIAATKHNLNVCECLISEFNDKIFHEKEGEYYEERLEFLESFLEILEIVECNLFSIDELPNYQEKIEECITLKNEIINLKKKSKKFQINDV